jgi:uncharacterized protein with HEPN domain
VSKSKINLPKDELAELCRRYHIRKMSLYGSVLRDDFRHVNYNIVWTVATSDLPPLLAELERMAPPEPPESEASSNSKEHP